MKALCHIRTATFTLEALRSAFDVSGLAGLSMSGDAMRIVPELGFHIELKAKINYILPQKVYLLWPLT